MIEKNDVTAFAEEFLRESPDYYLTDVTVAPGNSITVEIDRDNGVDIDCCAELSRYLESKFDRDVEDFELTVTSAGLTSPFKTKRQYKKYEGKEVELLTKKGVKWRGVLKTSDDNGFTVEISKMEKPEGGKRKIEVKEEQTYSYDEIKYTKYLIGFK